MLAVPAIGAQGRLRLWVCVAALLFSAATALTIAVCASMSSKGGMPMPGGWTMSMTWARMCGQTWPGAAAAFVGMWTAMTVAMMLPVLFLALWRGSAALEDRAQSRFVAAMGAGYFAVWIVMGVVFYPAGVGLAAVAMRTPALARAVPFASGVTVLMAGWFQLSATKARYLACCRAAVTSIDARAALREGVRLGWHCTGCCAGYTAMLFAIGVMDLRVMAFSAVAIAAERFARDGERVARIAGVLVVALGIVMVARTATG